MRDPKRIKKVLMAIKKAWKKNPDLRLMQLLGNCFDFDAYYIEDENLMDLLKEFYKERK